MSLTLFFITIPASAQVSVGGLFDLELRHAGEGSNPGINGTPGDGTAIYTPSLRLFFDAEIDGRWSVLASVQSNYYGSRTLNPPSFALLAVQWQPFADRTLFLSGGRLIIPVGSYSERFLSSEHPFRHLPVSHEWTLPVDKKIGYTTGPRSYETNPGMTLIYNQMYTHGIGLETFAGENNQFHFRLLWGDAAPSGFYQYSAFGLRSVMGRVVWQPSISTRIGVSGGVGPYMKPGNPNDMLPESKLREFTQMIAGLDIEYSYRYVILRLEYLNNTWSAPKLTQSPAPGSSPIANSTGTWFYEGEDLDNLQSHFLSGELIYRLRWIPGLSLVTRFDQVSFNDPYASYGATPTITGYDGNAWYASIRAAEAGLNYTLSRSVSLKVTASRSWFGGEDIKANTLGAQISAAF